MRMVTLLIVVGAVLGVHANAVAQTMVFSDNFDCYCHSTWPNCGCPGTPGDRWDWRLRYDWPWNSWNYNMGIYDGGNWIIDEPGDDGKNPDVWSEPYGGRIYNGGNENGEAGQNQMDLRGAINAAYGDTEINGTDASPLILEFWMGSKTQDASSLTGSNGYMELALTDEINPPRDPAASDQAPTDFVEVGVDDGTGCVDCYHACPGPEYSVHVPWLTICQQEFRRTGVSYSNCPPLDTNVRPVIAIGALSFLDPDPCHCNTPSAQKPRNEHLSFYDGLKWRILRSGMFEKLDPADSDTFLYSNKVNFVKIWIKTNTFDIAHWAHYANNPPPKPDDVYSTAKDIPREYLGPFNVLRSGVGVGCELNESTYSCKQPVNGYRPIHMGGGSRCDGGGYQESGANFVAIDNIELKGGVGASTQTGACCIPDDGSCVDDTLQSDCETTLGGAWRGIGSTCANEVCCVDPFADDDGDDDVDQADFGAWQACFSGSGNAYPTGCECFDRHPATPDGDVDGDDFTVFMNCWSGPSVAVNPACDD